MTVSGADEGPGLYKDYCTDNGGRSAEEPPFAGVGLSKIRTELMAKGKTCIYNECIGAGAPKGPRGRRQRRSLRGAAAAPSARRRR
jgi:hypothetical protein